MITTKQVRNLLKRALHLARTAERATMRPGDWQAVALLDVMARHSEIPGGIQERLAKDGTEIPSEAEEAEEGKPT
jgi:hypothetical protein